MEVKLMNYELTDCDSCTLKDSTKVPSFIAVDNKVEILVVGQSPGYEEVKQGRPFIGRSGELINPILQQYSQFVAYINVISCRPLEDNKDRMPTSTEVRCCRQRLIEDFQHVVNTYKPKIIFALGAFAKKETARICKNFPEYEKQYPFINMDHPAYILRNRHLESRYITQMHNGLKSVFGNGVDDVTAKFVTYSDKMKHQFLADVATSHLIGVDIETNSLNMFDPNFVIGTIAISCENSTYFFDCRNRDIREFEPLIDALKDSSVQKVFSDILFDVVALKQYGIEVVNYTDLFPLAFIYDNTYNEYSLEALTMRYKPDFAGYKSKFKSVIVENDYLGAPTEALMSYNCMDAYCTRMLYNRLYGELSEKAKMVFEKITVKLLPVLVSMKCCGMKVDMQTMDKYRMLFENRYAELVLYFRDKYGITAINSVPQIRKWLFETLKVKSIKKTDGGESSTDKEVLEAYATQIPDVRLLYEARRLANILNYFVPSISENLDFHDIVHPNYKHYGIQSFRLSCLRPNLQGIPRDETGIEILDKNPLRRLFCARLPDSYMLEFDYSQQEVRIIADLAKDVKMLSAFSKNVDIHTYVGSLVFNKEMTKITKMERQIAKGCVFGAIFGASAKEMSIRLHITEKQAQTYLSKFFDIFSNIEKYIGRQHDALMKSNSVTTILGRPRKFVIHQNNINDSKREAANHTIQAVASDITFLSLIRIYERLTEDELLGKEAFIIHSVHDSILLDVRKSHLRYVTNITSEIMSGIPKVLGFNVPFPITYTVGKRWGLSEKLEDILNED